MSSQANSPRPRSLADKFAFVEAKLHERGLQVKPGSRLQREKALFVGPDGSLRTVQEDDPDFDDALEGLRDYTLFERILESPLFRRRDALADSKLKVALRDAVNPYESPRTPGRDTELELFVAAELDRGGVPVAFVRTDQTQRTPDVRARVNGQFYFVEAKRAKSPAAILDAVDDGVKQVRATGCPGSLFIETTLAFNPQRGRITRLMSDEEFIKLYFQALRQGIRPFEGQLRQLMSGSRVGGIAFQDHQLRKHPTEGWQLESMRIMFDNPAASPRIAAAWQSFQRTLPRERLRP